MGQRRYNSPLRGQRKAETINQILDAAVRLHGQGITDLASVAREAGVALTTVTKYFPTREDLFRGCFAHFAGQSPLPSPAAWAAIADPAERTGRVVGDLYGGFEAAFGHLWLSYLLAGESAVMAANVEGIEALCRQAARAILGEREAVQWPESVAFVAGILSPLTYRSFRLVSRLEPEQAVRWAVRAIEALGRPQE